MALKKAVSFILAVAILLSALTVVVSAAGYKEYVSSSTLKKARFLVGSTWIDLPHSAEVNYMDGFQLQTSTSYYYLEYRIKAAGTWSNWYKSNSSTYPTSGGKPITNIQIRVFNNVTGAYDYTDFVIMFRAKVAGEWLDWVSNGEPAIMDTIKRDYSLSGNLDYSATDSGWASRGNIKALEIRMYEKYSHAATANTVLLKVPYINQKAVGLPNGCESVSATMALQYIGVNISAENFVKKYLPMGNAPSNGVGADPSKVFVGDPHLTGGLGWGCYAPVIAGALTKAIDKSKYFVRDLTGCSLATLCHSYIDAGMPVVMWATVAMTSSVTYSYWTTPEGKSIKYNNKLHCLLLVGYDDGYYYFNDPMTRIGDAAYFSYPKAKVEAAYNLLGKQAVALERIVCNGITIDSYPNVTEYFVGDEFNPEGLAVTAHFSDGSSAPLTTYDITGFDSEVPGEKTIEVSYAGFTGGTFIVNVMPIPSQLVRGDATGDGEVDMRDVLECRLYIAGLKGPEDFAFYNADVFCDNMVDMKDVIKIRRIIVGLDDTE